MEVIDRPFLSVLHQEESRFLRQNPHENSPASSFPGPRPASHRQSPESTKAAQTYGGGGPCGAGRSRPRRFQFFSIQSCA